MKKNNDKMNSIKLNNDIKAHSNKKLKEAMDNLMNEKNDIEKKYGALQKRIEDIDKEKIRSKSIPRKKVLPKPKIFKNLKKISNDKFTIIKGELKKENSKIIPNKNKPIKKTKKKFQKLTITKNSANVIIISKVKTPFFIKIISSMISPSLINISSFIDNIGFKEVTIFMKKSEFSKDLKN